MHTWRNILLFDFGIVLDLCLWIYHTFVYCSLLRNVLPEPFCYPFRPLRSTESTHHKSGCGLYCTLIPCFESTMVPLLWLGLINCFTLPCYVHQQMNSTMTRLQINLRQHNESPLTCINYILNDEMIIYCTYNTVRMFPHLPYIEILYVRHTDFKQSRKKINKS